tara:strand:+ start:37 stop:594 length:558 start_codon:yes stop_codon:yes gene_type:complete
MAGIEDLVKVYRGENVLDKLKNLFVDSGMTDKAKAKIGRFATTSADYASRYARKFPNVVKSTSITPTALNIGKKLFDKMHFSQGAVGSGGHNIGALQILSKKNKNKLKVDILKTFISNTKALTPLAMKGLNVLASLPVATLTMVLQSTPANADEANMQLEDFAKLAANNNLDREGIETIDIGDME